MWKVFAVEDFRISKMILWNIITFTLYIYIVVEPNSSTTDRSRIFICVSNQNFTAKLNRFYSFTMFRIIALFHNAHKVNKHKQML